MAEPKNPFDFGTGSIDKDQWQRDIDNEQDAFIARYQNATNKKRGLLLRQAFQDLRKRIANGDMLNRTADGQYQFGSALLREDADMKEAYQRALGFMGDLARRQIQAPPAEPEKKKYSSKTLNDRFIRYFNPSGSQESFTSLWNSYDDTKRKQQLQGFLRSELSNLEKNYQDVEDYDSMDNLKTRINDFLSDPSLTNLNRLGFNRNYLSQLQTEEDEEEKPKSQTEQLQQQLEQQKEQQDVRALQEQVMLNQNRNVEAPLLFNLPQYSFDNAFNNYLNRSTDDRVRFYRGIRNGAVRDKDVLTSALSGAKEAFMQEESQNLDNYFKDLGTNYISAYNNTAFSRDQLLENLSKLFSKNGNNYTYQNLIDKYLISLGNGRFYIPGSLDPKRGHYNYIVPYDLEGQTGIYDASLAREEDQNEFINNLYRKYNPSYKEGGSIKMYEDGGITDAEYSKYVAPYANQTSSEQSSSTPKQKSSSFSTAENARIVAAISDIASMGAAFVPGYGTAASAVLGLGSTATNFGADLADGQGLWDATKNAGFGLAADVMGLIPGLGGVGKGAKIARNLMWAVPKMMQWVNTYQGLQNAGEIKNSIIKLTSPSSMTVQDWQNVSQALQIMTGHGRSVATKIKKAGMSKTTTTTDPEYYIFTNKGKQKVSDETFKKLREARGTKARQALTQELMGDGITLQQTRFAPWNTSTRFGAFKEVPGKTKVEIQNKHKGWLSDENLVERVENADPSVDIRSILYKINPYRAYYANRNQPIIPQRNYSSFEARMNAEASPLDIRGPKQPYPTGKSQAPKVEAPETEAPKTTPKSQNKKKKKHRKHEIGGILKALRNGGIIKAKWGDDTSDWTTPQYNPESLKPEEKAIYTNPYFPNIQYNGTAPWYKSRFSGESVVNLGNDDSKRANLPGGLTGNNLDYAFARNQAYVKSGQQNKQADIQGYFDQLQSPIDANNLQGLTDIYNKAIDELYLPFTSGKNVPDYLKTDATKHNLLFRQVYGSRAKANEGDDNYDIGWNPDIIKTFGSASFARRPVNYETKWEDDLKNNLTQARDRVSKISHNGIEGYVYTDENGRIHPLTNNQLKLINGQQSPQKQDEGKEPSKVTDSEGSKETIFNTEYKNPIDPTLGIIAAKTAMGLAGNRNIYKNLLDEMPQAPLRDPIDRKLAIVGWQERIKNGQNQLADLRRVQQIQQGTDQQANFATALDVERIGRDIMDKSFQEDSGRQFETAQKSWNLDNEDTLYNAGVGDANRRAIADRARMMAQIRAAWRSGDNNIKMGAISDTGNWLLKKYQREQDIVDKAKELALGTPEEWAQSEYTSRLGDLANKKASDMTEMEKARVQEVKAQVLREMRQKYSQKYQSTFGTNLFGGGTKEVLAKDGAKLEVAKLKARSKDNDRYVSMMKDLRTTRYRRRRR